MLLDNAAADALADKLTPDHAAEAHRTAHILAGSLGMYGYPEGTRLARELEQLFQEVAPDPERLIALIAAIRAAIFPSG